MKVVSSRVKVISSDKEDEDTLLLTWNKDYVEAA
jgi:hypothetical protein